MSSTGTGSRGARAGGGAISSAVTETGVLAESATVAKAEIAAGGEVVAGVEPASGQERLIDEVRAALFELLGAERRLRGRDQHHRQGDLTNAQLRALMVLRDGEQTAGHVAESSFCNPASTTAMLDHLEGAGVVQRRRSSEDRRVCLVSLTEEGRRIVEEKRARSQEIWQERFAGASDRDLRAAARAMRTIAEMLDAH
jgi:DNA-binding MarR family transcriptional regulator